jgi:hypothetical protein
MKCHYCGGSTAKVPSLRHNFLECRSCGTFFTEAKNKNIFDYLFWPFTIFSVNHKSKSNQFSYYLRIIDEFARRPIAFNQDKVDLFKNLDQISPLPAAAKICDFGGGPGVDAVVAMTNNSQIQIDVTDYNKDIVEKMKASLGLNAYYLDFEKIEENNLSSARYDVILLFYTAYYCIELNKLIKLISEKLNPKGIVILEQNAPSFATATKFSITESYPPHVFHSASVIKSEFASKGFRLIEEKTTGSYNFISQYFYNFGSASKAVISVFGWCFSIYYFLINKIVFRNANVNFIISNRRMVFKRE